MNRFVYNLVDEVKGESYVRLLHHALSYCDSFMLVIRYSVAVNATAEAVLNRLEPYLTRREEKDEWPGTKLLDGTAQVSTFELSSATASILAEVADTFFSWMQPDLPEDLCLFRKEGDPWLVTIAHEKDAYLVLSPEESTALAKSIPTLSLHQHQEVGS